MEILKVKDVSKSYKGQKALDRVSFNLESGQVVGLLGPNGSGKTSLLKIIANITRTYDGLIEIEGKNPSVETKKIVSYLPDRPFLDPNLTVNQTKDLFADFYQDFDQAKFDKLIREMDLDPNAKILKLSKGMAEKLNLSLILSRAARLYVIDEPIAGVDPVARDQILDTLISNMAENSTMLITTHLVHDIERIFDRVIMLDKGHIILDDSVEKLREKYKMSIEDVYKKIFAHEFVPVNE
ncbi:MAG: ABC transporter ATP-binding protein [Finegoldia sp.]|nr:ABC transporter ATP-binding protein [Finegoldia sp.]